MILYVNLSEDCFKKFVKERKLFIDTVNENEPGYIYFSEWYNQVLYTRKFLNESLNVDIYVNNKKVDLLPILYYLNIDKRCIESTDVFRKSSGIKRRRDLVLDTLIDAAIFKTRGENNGTSKDI